MKASTTQLVSYQDLIQWQLNLINQLSTNSIEYIGIAVTLILFLGGVFYLFTLRPFEKELERQALDIKNAKDSLKSLIENESKSLKNEIEKTVFNFDEKSDTLLKKAEISFMEKATSQISVAASLLREDATKISAENASSLSKTKEDLIEEIRVVDAKIAKLDTTITTQTKTVENVLSTQTKQESTNRDLDLRLRVVETYRFSKENLMGSITVPINTIDSLIGTKDAWRIPKWLETLKESVTGVLLKADQKSNIVKVLDKLPAEHTITKNEIISILQNSKKEV